MEFLVLENAYIKITFLPTIGDKMVELKGKETSTQWLVDLVCSCTLEKLIFEFDPLELPYVYMSWENNGRSGTAGTRHSILFIQPSIGLPDSLQRKYGKHEHAILKAYDMDEWSLRISLS